MTNTVSELKQHLQQAGFKEWHTNSPVSHEHAESRWQCRIRSKDKTLYFINAYVYNTPTIHPNCIEFEAALYCKGWPDSWITVELHACPRVESALFFFQKAYEQLRCEPDRHNN